MTSFTGTPSSWATTFRCSATCRPDGTGHAADRTYLPRSSSRSWPSASGRILGMLQADGDHEHRRDRVHVVEAGAGVRGPVAHDASDLSQRHSIGGGLGQATVLPEVTVVWRNSRVHFAHSAPWLPRRRELGEPAGRCLGEASSPPLPTRGEASTGRLPIPPSGAEGERTPSIFPQSISMRLPGGTRPRSPLLPALRRHVPRRGRRPPLRHRPVHPGAPAASLLAPATSPPHALAPWTAGYVGSEGSGGGSPNAFLRISFRASPIATLRSSWRALSSR